MPSEKQMQKPTTETIKNSLRLILLVSVISAFLWFRFLYTGWLYSPFGVYYIDRGLFASNEWIEKDGNTYRVGKDGRRLAGEQVIGTGHYLFDEDGVMQTGWIETENGLTYYDSNGRRASGTHEIQGSTYSFSDTGRMLTGWQYQNGRIRYFGEDGKLRTGTQKIRNSTYLFDRFGSMRTGWILEGEDWYYYSAGGKLLTGEQKIKGKYYYLGEDGKMQTGWVETENGKKYHKSSGAAVTGWAVVDGVKSYFDEEGYMRSGHFEISGEHFYLEKDGSIRPGWHEDETGDFFVLKDGFVPDMTKPIGNCGRLIIRDCGIDVALETSDDRLDYQDITDRENTALYVEERRDTEPVIADRRSQGFTLSKAVPGETTAYVFEGNGQVNEYICASAETGKSTGEDVLDADGHSVWKQNASGICTYTGAGNGDNSVLVVFWRPV